MDQREKKILLGNGALKWCKISSDFSKSDLDPTNQDIAWKQLLFVLLPVLYKL